MEKHITLYKDEEELIVTVREYVIDQSEGLSIIQIFSDGLCTCFKSSAEVLAAGWPDLGGSVGQYYAVSNYSRNKKISNTYEFNQILIFGKSLGYTDEDLFNEINNFLKLFSPGNYNVYLLNESHNLSYALFGTDYDADSQMSYESNMRGWYYPPFYDMNIISTLSDEKINNERVDYYINLIKEGIFPKAVIYHHNYKGKQVNMSGCEFYVVDGHHKLKAYKKCGTYPNFVCIEKMDIENYDTSLYKSVSIILNREEGQHLKGISTDIEKSFQDRLVNDVKCVSKGNHVSISYK